MLKGFRDFITRGNVVDLAVGVVVGSAFTAIITAFTKNLINPLIASIGGVNADGLGFRILRDNANTFLDFGAVITAVINFLIVAAVLYFVIVAPMAKYSALRERIRKDKKEEQGPTEGELLTEIRDLLKAQAARDAAARGSDDDVVEAARAAALAVREADAADADADAEAGSEADKDEAGLRSRVADTVAGKLPGPLGGLAKKLR